MTANEELTINERIKELYKVIADATSELKELREKCDHPMYHIGRYEWRTGSSYITRICDECHLPLKGMSDEEKNSFSDIFTRQSVSKFTVTKEDAKFKTDEDF